MGQPIGADLLESWAGFGIRGYRSYGGENVAVVGPMEKVHLVVGRNNVGKSNLLKVMNDVLPHLRDTGSAPANGLFPRREDTPLPWEYQRAVTLGLFLTEDVKQAFQLGNPNNPFNELFKREAYTTGTQGSIWLEFDLVQVNDTTLSMIPSLTQYAAAASQGQGISTSHLQGYSSQLTSSSSSEPQTNLNNVFNAVRPWRFIPATEWVDAIRELTAEVDAKGSDTGLRNGRGLVPRLAKLARPSIATRKADQAKFRALQDFVRDVVDDPDAEVEIPQSQDTIHVVFSQGEAMALDSLGTGIHEVVMLAAVSTIIEDTLVCMEEPELHLHPTLQRKLIAYLHRETTNRYLISTHSAALLNAELASISHVTSDSGFSVVRAASSPATIAHAVSDLGNRASDLVQSNFLVWVEGPSDRIYVNHWLHTKHPDLVEGAHYSIMFYGGALLNHLAVDDKATDEFISLLNINRNLAILIDSDRKQPDDDLNDTKRRILREIKDIDALAWVTHGYTVENYARKEALETVIAAEYPGKTYRVPSSRHSSPLASTFNGLATKPSKITVARAVAERAQTEDGWHEDLWPQVAALAEAIRDSNDMH